MIPNQTLIDYPEFGNNGTKVKPGDQKYAQGFIPADVLPAEWLNWFLNKSSSAVTELNKGVASIEAELNNLLAAGSQNPAAEQTSQVAVAISKLIQNAIETEQQKTAVGVPTLWIGPKPNWALDFGNGAATQYLWANYPKLNNDKFKSILATFSNNGWCAAYNSAGFYVPDLRGIVPIGYGTNAKKSGCIGDAVGKYRESANKAHTHTIIHSHTLGNMNFTGFWRSSQVTHSSQGISTGGSLYDGGKYYIGTTDADGSSYSIGFSLANGWNGKAMDAQSPTVSGSAGTTQAKPATVACMWIVRFE